MSLTWSMILWAIIFKWALNFKSNLVENYVIWNVKPCSWIQEWSLTPLCKATNLITDKHSEMIFHATCHVQREIFKVTVMGVISDINSNYLIQSVRLPFITFHLISLKPFNVSVCTEFLKKIWCFSKDNL